MDRTTKETITKETTPVLPPRVVSLISANESAIWSAGSPGTEHLLRMFDDGRLERWNKQTRTWGAM